ncbi:uncharacterized protein [Rutidosis leptorrhynchoides]|uniref:uncharacterized protein n=1 Tax=Rutidosis leptorrhynchoides TaxID=125765 RepID=UPI003A9907F3
MAGKATFESTSNSWSEPGFLGGFMNGKRGVRSAAAGSNLDRSVNVREGSESRKFGLGFDMVHDGSGKASEDIQSLSECVSLEPIVIHDQISRVDESRRVLGLSAGNTTGDNSFGPGSASHVKPLPPVAVVKDLKRFRSSVADTCVKARVRANEIDERLRNLDRYYEARNSKKQHRSELVSNDRPSVLSFKPAIQTHNVNQRVDRPKNILLNKRVRTSVAESRAECRNNGVQMQPAGTTNDGNVPEDNDGESDLFEKIRRLAPCGDGWDKKGKRKRSSGTLFMRPNDSGGAPKRVAAQNKIVNEGGSQPRDADVYRLSNRDESQSNRKRPMPSVSSSPPMAQWVGQRPQKMARARRPSLVSAVSNQDPNQISFENPSLSDVGADLVPNGTNGPPISRNATSGPQKLIVKLENVQSSSRLSENEESIGGETRSMGRKLGNSEMSPVSKNKPPLNAVTPKPFQSSKNGYKKNGSKPGRRLKKLSDRKGFPDLSPSQNNKSPDCPGASDDDREELLAAANHARIARHLACSSLLWKKMEPVFASCSSEVKSLLFQQMGPPHENSLSDQPSSIERKTHIQHPETESFSESNVSVPLYQRVLSALIIEDDVPESEDATYDTYGFNEYESFPSNVNTNSFKTPVNNNLCEDANIEVEILNGVSNGFLNKQQTSEKEGSLDAKLLLELQSIGLYLDELPGLNEKEDETLQREVDKLNSRLHQQEVKKKAYFEKLRKGVESDSGIRDLETLAMDRLVELAYKKLLLATKRSSRSMINKVPKQSALAFGRRTLARCRKFETSGKSCFSEPLYQDILSAPIENEPDPNLLSDEGFTTSNKGKKKEFFLDDIGTRTPSYVGVSGGTKGKRSERDPTKSRKPKPRQKSGQIQVSGTGSVNKNSRSLHPTGPTWPSSNRPNNESSNRSTHPTGPTWPSSKGASQLDTRSNEGTGHTNPSLDDLDPLDDLGVGGDLGGPADFDSFLNIDDHDLDEDFAGGLDIPMDDLTELF